MKKTTYQPISCDFYDELELLALRKQLFTLDYLEEGTQKTMVTSIKNLQAKAGEEFLITEANQSIRLDAIIAINGKTPRLYC